MDLFENDRSQNNELVYIKFFKNGGSKPSAIVKACPIDDDVWKIKKRLLKKLKYKNYKDHELQESVRLFTMKGIEMTEADLQDLKIQKSVIFSMGDDFDFSVRINALKFVRKLGQGGFGEVNLCIDQLTGDQVAVKHLSYESQLTSS